MRKVKKPFKSDNPEESNRSVMANGDPVLQNYDKALSSLARTTLREIKKKALSVTADGAKKNIPLESRTKIIQNLANLIAIVTWPKFLGQTEGIFSEQTVECCMTLVYAFGNEKNLNNQWVLFTTAMAKDEDTGEYYPQWTRGGFPFWKFHVENNVTRSYTLQDPEIIRRIQDALEVWADLYASPETSPGVGNSMLDAALVLNDGDKKIALETVHRWQKKRTNKLTCIGFDPKHSQRKLYEPVALVNYIIKIEGNTRYDYRNLIQSLTHIARIPRSNINQS